MLYYIFPYRPLTKCQFFNCFMSFAAGDLVILQNNSQ